MSKSIIIDATHYASERATGVELYVKSLLPELVKCLEESGSKVSLIGHEESRPSGLPASAAWIQSPHTRLWSQTALPKLLNNEKADLFFAPSNFPPITCHGRVAMTIHDLGVYAAPESFKPGEVLRTRLLGRLTARHAATIIVPSLYTKHLVTARWHIPDERCILVPHAHLPLSETSSPLSLPSTEPVFLFVGRLEWKKNLLPVIEGFAKYAAESAGQLVLAGKDGYGSDEVRKAIRKLNPEIQKRITLTGYVSEEQKRWLYGQAYVCLVPGLTEGFGFPVLEAFSAGVPVLCSQSGSLPEVGQDAAVYVQGDIATDWYLQMKKVEDDELRKRLVKRGQELLKDYTWKKSAQLTAKALLEAAA